MGSAGAANHGARDGKETKHNLKRLVFSINGEDVFKLMEAVLFNGIT